MGITLQSRLGPLVRGMEYYDALQRLWVKARKHTRCYAPLHHCTATSNAHNGRAANRRGAHREFKRPLLPLRRTAAATNGQFGAPQVLRDARVCGGEWALLGDAAAAVDDTAAALARAVMAVVRRAAGAA